MVFIWVLGKSSNNTWGSSGGGADSVRLLLTKNSVCSFNCPSTGVRVWKDPATPADSWPDRTAQIRAYGGRRSSRDVCGTGRLLRRQRRRRLAASCSRKRFASSLHHCFAEGGDDFSHLRASAHHGFHQGRKRSPPRENFDHTPSHRSIRLLCNRSKIWFWALHCKCSLRQHNDYRNLMILTYCIDTGCAL